MSHFKASHPDNTTYGGALLAVANIMGEKAKPILEANNLADVDPNGWYPQQQYLNVFREISSAKYGAIFNLVSIGMEIIPTVAFPPNVTTLEQALMGLDAYYHLNNKDEVYGWQTTQTAPTRFMCVSTTPFPSDMEYGILFALCRRFLPAGTQFTVSYAPNSPTRKNGADSCTYIVEW